MHESGWRRVFAEEAVKLLAIDPSEAVALAAQAYRSAYLLKPGLAAFVVARHLQDSSAGVIRFAQGSNRQG